MGAIRAAAIRTVPTATTAKMKKFIQCWCDRRLKKWCIKNARRHDYALTDLVGPKLLYDWITSNERSKPFDFLTMLQQHSDEIIAILQRSATGLQVHRQE